MKKKSKINSMNTPYLVIVESPSKCSKIEKYLGIHYKCIASKGHLREIVKVHPSSKNYKIEFGMIEEKKTHIDSMKSIISMFNPENVFLATDDDREGEGIGWHICELFNLNVEHTKRIIFHEITQEALVYAVNNPIRLRMNIVIAQQTRQILDRMIGFQISPIISRLLVHNNAQFLSAGRCQTPTLRLIYDKYKTNLNKKEKICYKIQGTFFTHPSSLVFQLEENILDENLVKHFLNESKSFPHRFKLKEKQTKSTLPPKPFNTSQLLQTASNLLHISPKHVMDICQKLYQDGKITYMRTESTKLSLPFLEKCTQFITDNYGDYVGNTEKLTNKNSKTPHEAIRVTNIYLKSVTSDDRKFCDIYKLIWQRSLECCMKEYYFDKYDLEITAPFSVYKTNIEIPTFLGWKRVQNTEEKMRETQEKNAIDMCFYKKFDTKEIPYKKIQSNLFMKDLDKYYQEASLIQKLENIGIGRPSTFSMLVETIQARKYVTKGNIEGEIVTGNEYTLYPYEMDVKKVEKTFGASKNKIKINILGIQAIETLLKYFNTLFDYEFTSKMEEELDLLVTDVSKNYVDICKQFENMIKECSKPLLDVMKKKYKIDEDHTFVFGKSGMMILCESSGKYKSLNKDLNLDLEKLIKGEYILDELISFDNTEEALGTYENEELYVKEGPYGKYATWGTNKCSLKGNSTFTFEKILEIIQKDKKDSNLLRVLNSSISVRKGKYGNYIFYKTEAMKKPKFINIKKCPHDVLKDDVDKILEWVEETLRK